MRPIPLEEFQIFFFRTAFPSIYLHTKKTTAPKRRRLIDEEEDSLIQRG